MAALLILMLVATLSNAQYDAQQDEDSGNTVVNIIILSDEAIEVDDDFAFSCNVTDPNLTISLIIDNKFTGDKFNRVNTTVYETETVFIFEDVITHDNGTTFMCIAIDTSDNTTYHSDIITLQVLSAPIFAIANNKSSYLFIKTGDNATGNCTVMYANPPVTDLLVTNNSKHFDNVKFTKGLIMFMNATTGNHGNYTCTATNDIGSTYLKYNTFIGGVPNDVSINITNSMSNDSISLSVNITDNSNAPAQSICISLGEYSANVTFSDIPVMKRQFMNILTVDRNGLLYANYTPVVRVKNVLGNTTVSTGPIFLNGSMPLNVDIIAENGTITTGDNYTFACEVLYENNSAAINYTFDIIINNGAKDAHDRLMKGVTDSNQYQIYTFMNADYNDVDTTFTCIVNSKYISDEQNMTILYAPVVLSDVIVPNKTVGDPRFNIVINYTANPPLSYTKWSYNGVDIVNSTRIFPVFNTIEFLSLEPEDNGMYRVILYNEIGSVTYEFDMTVFYAPILSVANEVGGFLGQPVTIQVSVDANPSEYNSNWLIHGEPLMPGDNMRVTKNSLEFTNLTKVDIANYTLKVENGIGHGNEITFELLGYDGPYFMEGFSNSSNLTEYKTGSSYNLTCHVTSAVPAITSLTIEPAKGPNWVTVTDSNSVTVILNNVTAEHNTRNYTCIAMNNVTTAKLQYNNYVGGAPDNVKVSISMTDEGNVIILKATVFDNSSVPATNVSFYLKNASGKNITKSYGIPDRPLYGRTVTLGEVLRAKHEELGVGMGHSVIIYARNMIGREFVSDYSFTIPDNPTSTPKTHKKSHAGAIAAGIIVPLAVISFAVVGVLAFCYYRRKRNRTGYDYLPESDDTVNINSSGYRTDKVIT